MATDKEIFEIGHYLDLDHCELAYELGGVNTTFHDYSNGDDLDDSEWDRYYDDFNEWWESLSVKERRKIYEKLIKKD